MNHKKIIVALLLIGSFILTVGFVAGDTDPIQHIIAQLQKWEANYPVEKVYLHLDKPYYAAGDDIWFKAYATIGPEHKLSALSGSLTVDLIDDRDSVKQSIKLPLTSGLAAGDFALSDTLAEGNYRIRAYTNWMRNFGEEYFFDKTIAIVNSSTNKIFTTTSYSYSIVNGQQHVNAVVNYADINKVPYTNHAVKYSVMLGAKSITRGKGVTDDKGNITIDFINPNPAVLNSGNIITGITMDDKTTVTKTIPVHAASANVDVQFFPEGGSLVNNVISKMAFKALAPSGLGVDVKGTVTDEQNNTVTAFSSQHLGMGVFTFEPMAGHIYKATVTLPDGSVKIYDLPAALDKGYVLSVDNADPAVMKLKVTASHNTLLAGATDTLDVIIQSGGHIYFAAKSKPGGASFTASINKSHFPSGIMQVTVFSSNGEPINERLVFVQNADQAMLDVKAAKETSSPREKVKINLGAKEHDGGPAIGSFSVAVTDENKMPVNEDDESSILSNLLLTSDLKGYVEKPGYYFNHINDKTQADLDMLMLTQGYRRFEWKKILKDDFLPVIHQPQKMLQVSGHITTLGGKPIVHGKVNLVSIGGGFLYLDTLTDEHGHFTFDKLAFKDSLKFVVQARNAKDGKNVTINLDDVAPQGVAINKNAPDRRANINDGLGNYLKSSKDFFSVEMQNGIGNHSVVLKEVVVKAKAEPLVKYSNNLNGPGNADQVITADKLGTCADLASCLQMYANFIIFKNGNAYSTRGGVMKIMIDGVSFPNMTLSDVNVQDVASVEVLRTPEYTAIYGSQAGPGGLLVITTKRGDDLTKEYMSRPSPGIISFSPKGFYRARVFYSPSYDDPKTNKDVADKRTTIYWNHQIITDKDGNASVEFYNAGSKGNYRVVVEGITATGALGRQVYRYKVE